MEKSTRGASIRIIVCLWTNQIRRGWSSQSPHLWCSLSTSWCPKTNRLCRTHKRALIFTRPTSQWSQKAQRLKRSLRRWKKRGTSSGIGWKTTKSSSLRWTPPCFLRLRTTDRDLKWKWRTNRSSSNGSPKTKSFLLFSLWLKRTKLTRSFWKSKACSFSGSPKKWGHKLRTFRGSLMS